MNQQIIMNFSLPPSADDLNVIAQEHLENIPEELAEFCDDLVIQIEEIPDEATESDLDLNDPFELLSLFKSAKELSPGIEKQGANDNDVLILYRRPILDMWCETGEHISNVVREAMIGELGNNFDFSEDEIEENERPPSSGHALKNQTPSGIALNKKSAFVSILCASVLNT